MCNTHYEQLRRSGNLEKIRIDDPVQRFWSYVDTTGECWEWTGGRSTGGYGRFYLDGKLQQAHRVAYELLIGPIPDGLELDHLCRNRGCVRPDHLDPVTTRVNLLRGEGHAGTNARKTHCNAGHPLGGEGADVYYRNGWRYCRKCRLDAALRYQRRKRKIKIITTSCVQCGIEFTYTGKRRKLCSDECRVARSRQISREFQQRKRASRP